MNFPGTPLFAAALVIVTCLLPGCSGNVKSDPAEVSRQSPRQSGDKDTLRAYVDFEADPSRDDVRLFWKDDTGGRIGSPGALREWLEGKRLLLRFACNGGMYMEDGAPVGLFIQDGRTVAPLNTRSASGNFYLKPNGVFYLTRGKRAVVVKTDGMPADRKDILWATQSGPMLVIDSLIHPVFKKGSENRNVRNGVGILPDGRILFAMSTGMVSLYDFAEHFRSRGCRQALYLDGFVSRTFCPECGWEQQSGDFGVMIGVVSPARAR